MADSNLKLLAAFILIVGITIPAPGQTQTEREKRSERPAAKRGEAAETPPAQGRSGAILERILTSVLTEEQRASLRQAMEKNQEKIRDIERRAREARRAMLETSLAEEFNESKVKEKALAAAKIEAELTVMRAKALAELQPPLTDEQRSRLKDMLSRGPGSESGAGARPPRHPDIPRDQNGLPLKEQQ
jgi:Spy/CpxP family protein refolding chaperone